MSLGFIIALSAALFSAAMGTLHFAMSRAPGWRGAWVFGVIAMSAALYASVDVVFCTAGLPEQVYMLAGRANYAIATVHIVAWLVYFFGGPDGSLSQMPRWSRWAAATGIGIGVFFAVTGLHIATPVTTIEIAWAHTTYHYPTSTNFGDFHAVALLALLAVSLVEAARRAARGEPGMRLQLAGFLVFFLCSTLETLVATRVLRFLSLGDLGFFTIVLTTIYHLVRRFIADARALELLSARLRTEVEVRTEERDAVQRRLGEVEPLAALGRLAAGVGHEINNPLVYVRSGLERVSEFVGEADAPAEVRTAVADATLGLLRIQGVVDALRVYSNAPLHVTSCEVFGLIDSATQGLRPELGSRSLEVTGEAPLVVLADAQRIVDALERVLRNAIRATAGRDVPGHIRVSAQSLGSDEMSIEIADDGVGIPPADLLRLGEPYFTTRAHEGATGLGLFAVRAVLGAHGGRLLCESVVGKGTTMRLVLPARGPAVAAVRTSTLVEPVSVAPSGLDARRIRVLVVDDEPLVLRSLERALRRRWEVVTAEGGERALELVRIGPPFDAVVSDVMMPGVSGIELADRLAVEAPELRRHMVFITAGAASPAAVAFLARDDVRSMRKPVAPSALVEEIESVLAQPQTQTERS